VWFFPSPPLTIRHLKNSLSSLLPLPLDPNTSAPYNGFFTVIYFFDLMNFSTGPAATRWAALFLAAPHSLEMRLE
jgi:hypothetical protein